VANRYCGNCGQELSPDNQFCPNCGRPVHETAQVSTPEADVNVPPPPAGQAAQAEAGQPGLPPPGTPQRGWGRRHPILTGCLSIVVLFFLIGIIGAALGGGGDETAGGGGGGGGNDGQQQERGQGQDQQQQDQQQNREQRNEGQGQEQETPEYTVGETATVGNVEWTVTDAYPTTVLTSDFGTEKQGNFVVVDFTFTNNRSEEVTLDPELHMILRDSRDREFGTDPDAWEYVPTDLNIFLEPVNPGISQDGRTIYEVPQDAQGFVLIVDDVEFLEDRTARYDLGF
jgi:hypothetical protein